MLLKKMRSTVVIAILTVGTLASQQQQPTLHSDDVVRANTRLVVVDVVATDGHGQPMKGLNAGDFVVSENGQPQKIAEFTFHHPGESTARPAPKLAPGVISNAPQMAASSLNVLLFDVGNGDFQAHAYGKEQLDKFLRAGPLGQPLAIYAMENELRLLHDFTRDVDALRTSVEQYRIPAVRLTGQSMESMATAFTIHGNYHADDRSIESTLNQLNTLAKILAGYPGRKNLIWYSEGFPLDFFPDSLVQAYGAHTPESTGPDGTGPGAVLTTTRETSMRDYSALVKKVAQALMAAQVAVYPVDSSGLGRDSHVSSLHTMNDLASRTGGKVYANRNDLAESLRAGVDDGSTYYTLEYYPDNKKWDGQFRAIQVKTSTPGVALRYREGYYALDPEKLRKEETDKAAEDYSRILKFDAPTVTGIQFQAAVLPPSKQTGNKVVVNFAVDPYSMNFSRSDDGMERAVLHCTVWAYGKDKNKPIMSKNDATSAAVKPDVYQQIMKSYFPCKQQLDLSAGTYTLKLGVLDRNSNRMGTLTTSVTVP